MLGEQHPPKENNLVHSLHEAQGRLEHFQGVLRSSFERVFVFNELDGRSLRDVLTKDSHGFVRKQEALRTVLEKVRNKLPEQVNSIVQRDRFENAPLAADGQKRYIGSGYNNAVYSVEYSTQPQFAVLFDLHKYKSAQEATARASHLQREHDYYSAMFPGLVPSEQFVVFNDYKTNPSVLCVKEFYPQPIRDLWSIDQNELLQICTTNNYFMDQFRQFSSTCISNLDELVSIGFDVVGTCNIAVVGDNHTARLVLLDPHNVNEPEKFGQCTRDCVSYLSNVLSELEK